MLFAGRLFLLNVDLRLSNEGSGLCTLYGCVQSQFKHHGAASESTGGEETLVSVMLVIELQCGLHMHPHHGYF